MIPSGLHLSDGGSMGPYYSFSHILLLSNQSFDQSWLFVIVTLIYAPFGAKKQKTKQNKNNQISSVFFTPIQHKLVPIFGVQEKMFCP